MITTPSQKLQKWFFLVNKQLDPCLSFEPAKSYFGNIRKVNANYFALQIKEILKILWDNMLIV